MDAAGGGGGGDGDGAGKAPEVEAPAETTPPPTAFAPTPAADLSSASGPGAGASGSGEKPVKRMMKTPYQLEVLESTYAVEQYPSEALRMELSAKIGLTDRQLQMWFCHRRLKDRKPPSKRQRWDEEAPVMAPPPVLPLPAIPLASSDLMMGTPVPYDEPLHHPTYPRRGAGRSSAVARISMPDIGRRYYDPPPVLLAPPAASMQLTPSELRLIHSVESQLGEPLRDDGPVLGIEFDPLPPGAFGAPIVPEQQKPPVRSYDTKIFSRQDTKLLKASAFLPTMEPSFVPNSFTGKRKSTVGNAPIVQPHVGSRTVHEYQFLPEQPSDTYERTSRSNYYDTSVEVSHLRISPLTAGSQLLHGSDEAAPSYAFQGQTSGSGLLPQSDRSQTFSALQGDYEMIQSTSNLNPVPVEGQFGISQVPGFENSLISSERRVYHDDESSRVDRKRKHNEEAKIAKEVEAHERRIRKELEKQDVLNRKREEQRRKEMERLDRERRKEEEKLLRERQREEERFQREQRREHERMEKFLMKQSRRAEKQRQKEEIRKQKEAARQKAANDRATARRIAREYMELVEDERLELMELAAQSKGLPSMLHLDSNTLQQLDSFRGMLSQFPPQTVRLKVPFLLKPWTGSEDNVAKLLMVWKFLITFTDVLGLSPVTLDEFVQCLHDYLKKRNVDEAYYRNDNEGHDGEDVISTLRSGSAAVNAAALMKERGYTHRRRSRHRLTPGTVKFAAFHVLSLEGSNGLTILEVAEKIQKSGLRDLTTSKTPEASIAAALSRDTKLFERTAPSTYCVKSPYRKDPADSESVLSAAREKIRAFQNVLSDSEGEKEADDAERDEDSEADDAFDDIDGDDTMVGGDKDPPVAVKAEDSVPTTATTGGTKAEADSVGNVLNSPSNFTNSAKAAPLKTACMSSGSPVGASSNCQEVIPGDCENAHIGESNQVEPWLQALSEGDYCDLSVEERLNALVALISVATEGNSIRAVLEERLESANALKKQMWAEAQLDKRRSKEEFASRMQCNSYMSSKADINHENNAAESTTTPGCSADKERDGSVGAINNYEMLDQHSQGTAGIIAYERNGVSQEISATPDTSAIQHAYADKTRSQLKSYIGHRAEQLYVYRSLPLGQDRRRNRYWQFIASASPNDPGSGRIFFESKDGHWRVIDSEEIYLAEEGHCSSCHKTFKSIHNFSEHTAQCEEKRRTDPNWKMQISDYSVPIGVRLLKLQLASIEASIPSEALQSFWSDVYRKSWGLKLYLTKSISEIFQHGEHEIQQASLETSQNTDQICEWSSGSACMAEKNYPCSCSYEKQPTHDQWDECLSRTESESLLKSDGDDDRYSADQRICDGRPAAAAKRQVVTATLNEPRRRRRKRHRTLLGPRWRLTKSRDIGPRRRPRRSRQRPEEAHDGERKSSRDGGRKFWLLTQLECAIRRDFLSSDFEATSECLNSNSQDIASQNPLGPPESATVLPWVPDTTAAVMLRMLDLDAAISYIQNQKMERDGDFMKLPSRYTVAKSTQATSPLEPTGFDLYDGRWLPGSSRRGRGRGSRGGRGGRGRSRGGRIPRGISSSSKIEFKDDNVANEKVPRKNARRGRTRGRGRGRGRGRRTVRPRQPFEGRARSIPKSNLLGSFSMLSSSKPSTVESPRSSGADEWGLETRIPYTEGDENSSGSQSDQSEDNEETGQPMNEEYEEQLPNYSVGYSDVSRPHGMMPAMDHDTDEEDEDAEGDGDGDDYVEEDDVEMDDDDEIVDDGDDDGGDGMEMNADEDEGATSYSSDYSE
ncbi:hypothetical protein PR202_ga10185 [Eleusine coracana subsp. coracana]|uniref:Uncharacterized protein n=1 Tax=Eleusine coracana subsp. coracana TaxID=191504 RepID=A0AAV5C617_ELECO|nr:hypothetical protein PR202_ga10185 [Eleusine coracana subsp. coracana]